MGGGWGQGGCGGQEGRSSNPAGERALASTRLGLAPRPHRHATAPHPTRLAPRMYRLGWTVNHALLPLRTDCRRASLAPTESTSIAPPRPTPSEVRPPSRTPPGSPPPPATLLSHRRHLHSTVNPKSRVR